jgi:outer membrane protein
MKIVTTLLSASLSLAAAELSYSDAINLDEAIEIVKNQNLEIKASGYDVQSAHATVNEAFGKNWGTLDLIQNVARSNDAGNVFGFKLTSREANFGDFGAEEFVASLQSGNPDYTTPPEALNYPDDRNFFQTKLEYTLPIYVGGKISGYTDIARSMERMKHLEKSQVVSEKIYETRKSFYDMALLENAIANLQQIFENITTLEEMTNTMIKEGYATKTDLLEVQAKKANVESAIYEMKANEELLYHYLSFLLNQKVSKIDVPESEAKAPDFSNDVILSRNVDLQRARTGLEIREEMVSVSRADYLPMIGLKADVQTAADGFDNYAMDKGSYTAGVQLKWNLFSGGSDYNKVEKAQVEELKTKTQVELAKKGIALKIDQIRTEIRSLDHKIKSLQKELDLANEIYQSYEARYREQLASMSDVAIKQSMQIEKVLELLKVKNQRNERVFALEKLANGVEE